jgi:hypothetical protein
VEENWRVWLCIGKVQRDCHPYHHHRPWCPDPDVLSLNRPISFMRENPRMLFGNHKCVKCILSAYLKSHMATERVPGVWCTARFVFSFPLKVKSRGCRQQDGPLPPRAHSELPWLNCRELPRH